MTESYVGVYLMDAPSSIDRLYDYRVPTELCDVVTRGSFVSVPFGNGNRHHLALVAEVKNTSAFDRVKPVFASCASRLFLSEEMLGLALFLKEQTLCTVGDAVRAMVPAATLSCMAEVYLSVPPREGEALPDEADKPLLSYIQDNGKVTLTRLYSRFGKDIEPALHRLRSRGLVRRDAEYRDSDPGRYTTYVSLAVSLPDARVLYDGGEVAGVRLRSEKQRNVLRILAETEGRMPEKELCEAAACTAAVIPPLVAKELLSREQVEDYRTPYDASAPAGPIVLNGEQQAALDTLCQCTDSGKPHGILLHGVTGSGKTSVMLKLIEHLLANGRGAIVLLPEIALTPQSIAIFSARFGDTIAVIHSGLSQGERYDAYTRIRAGLARVVVGTRSAVFAPVDRLGVIIIDEEQEHTYKSDSNPKYRVHDVARFRCAASGASMLLASATPSLESYKKAMDGTYTLLSLKNRYGGAQLPSVTLADMREDAQAGADNPLGTVLMQSLADVLSKGEQAILFLNRRGFHRFISCRSCGTAVTCPNCSLAMTYHTRKGTFDEGDLLCHFCGKRLPLPRVCPSCGSEHLVRGGYGTQRVEKELHDLFPAARILRMDTDTTTSRFSYDQMLGAFRAHEADILLGTQMVTKGHDFPGVTLVGVLNADSSLYLDDYRANERTFSMITQVVGRAGRGKKPGHAIIQTVNPDNDVIRLACAQDYETFYAREIKLRRLLVFPPFCDIALLTLSGEDEKELLLAARRLYEETTRLHTGEYADVKLSLFGPFEAPLYRAENRYRMRMVLKCRLNKRTRAFLAQLTALFTSPGVGHALLSVDLNPTNL